MAHRPKRRKLDSGAEAEVEAEAEASGSAASVAAVPHWTHTARDLLALRSTEAIRAAQQDLEAFALMVPQLYDSTEREGRTLYNLCRQKLAAARSAEAEAVACGEPGGVRVVQLMELRDLAVTIVALRASTMKARVEALRAHAHAGHEWCARAEGGDSAACGRAANAFACARRCCRAAGGLDAVVRAQSKPLDQARFAEVTLLELLVASAKCDAALGRSAHACELLVDAARVLSEHTPIARPVCIRQLHALGARLAGEGVEWSVCITAQRAAVRLIEQRNAAAESARGGAAAAADVDGADEYEEPTPTRADALYLLAQAHQREGDATSAIACLDQLDARGATFYALLVRCYLDAQRSDEASVALDTLLGERAIFAQRYDTCCASCVEFAQHDGWSDAAVLKFAILAQSFPARASEARTLLIQRLVEMQRSTGAGGAGGAERAERLERVQRIIDSIIDDHAQKRRLLGSSEQRNCVDVLWNASIAHYERYTEMAEQARSGTEALVASATSARDGAVLELNACCFLSKLALGVNALRCVCDSAAASAPAGGGDDDGAERVAKLHRLISLCMLERGDAEDALTHANAAAAAHDCKPSRLVRFAAHIAALCASSQDAAPPPLRATSPQSLQRDALAVTRDATLTVDDVDWCLQRVCAGCRGANSPSSHTLLAVVDELLALRFVTR